MNKNIVIGIIVVFIVVIGAFFFFSGEKAFDVSFLEQDEAELIKMVNDIETFSQDLAVADEVDQTLGDILDERVAIAIDEALDETSIAQEASEADVSQTLNAFAADDAALQELDQAFGEVSQ